MLNDPCKYSFRITGDFDGAFYYFLSKDIECADPCLEYILNRKVHKDKNYTKYSIIANYEDMFTIRIIVLNMMRDHCKYGFDLKKEALTHKVRRSDLYPEPVYT